MLLDRSSVLNMEIWLYFADIFERESDESKRFNLSLLWTRQERRNGSCLRQTSQIIRMHSV